MPAMLIAPISGETFQPQQLWEYLIVQRGFLLSPSGAKDAYRTRPAIVPDRWRLVPRVA